MMGTEKRHSPNDMACLGFYTLVVFASYEQIHALFCLRKFKLYFYEIKLRKS